MTPKELLTAEGAEIENLIRTGSRLSKTCLRFLGVLSGEIFWKLTAVGFSLSDTIELA